MFPGFEVEELTSCAKKASKSSLGTTIAPELKVAELATSSRNSRWRESSTRGSFFCDNFSSKQASRKALESKIISLL